MESTLRLVLATVVALVVMLVLQVPNQAFGLYVILVISNENPAITLRIGIGLFVSICLVILISLTVVNLTDNDPMARLVSLAAMTFVAGMIATATSLPALGSGWGVIFGLAIGYWESHAPADRLVKNTLWLLAAFTVGISVSIAVAYVFSSRSLVVGLAGQLRLRYRALAVMFAAYASDDVTEERRRFAAEAVSRLAAEGHREMLDTFRQIVDRHLPHDIFPSDVQNQIVALAELMDNAAAFGLQNANPDVNIQGRCKVIAQRCDHLARGLRPDPNSAAFPSDGVPATHLERAERTLLSIGLGQSADPSPTEPETLSLKHVPFLIPEAVRARENIIFALKISLCATICYIITYAIDWPAISTSVTTVMVAGLMTTGATKQRLIYRLIGVIAGGFILGLGAEIFLFPFMDSITALTVVVGAIAFLAAWIREGPRFSYIGIQIAFAFYLVALSGSGAPTRLAPARDRFVGVMLAVVVMWFVFDQIWPVRTLVQMRRVVASILKDAASVVALFDDQVPRSAYVKESQVLRDRLAKELSRVRALFEEARYELGLDRRRQLHTSETLLQMSMTAVALVWNHAVSLGASFDRDVHRRPALVKLRRAVTTGLSSIADAIEKEHEIHEEQLVADESESEYVRLLVARFNELRSLSLSLDRSEK
jgi:multidrug resistance protein MdtO